MDSRRGRIYLAAKKRAEGVEETGLGFGRIVLGKFLGRGWRGGDVVAEKAKWSVRVTASPSRKLPCIYAPPPARVPGCGITGSATDAGTRFWRNFSRTNLVLVLVFFILLVFV
jgi:hypothetical protein